MSTEPRLTPAQKALRDEIAAAGVLYITRDRRYYRTAQALVRKGVATITGPDYSQTAMDGYSLAPVEVPNG